MTIASEVKQSLASLKGIEADLSSLAIRTQDHESKRTLHDNMMVVHEVVTDLVFIKDGKIMKDNFKKEKYTTESCWNCFEREMSLR